MDGECLGDFACFHSGGYWRHTHTQTHTHAQTHTHKHTVEDRFRMIWPKHLKISKGFLETKNKKKQSQHKKTKHRNWSETHSSMYMHTARQKPTHIHTHTHTHTHTPQPGATYLVCFLILSVVMWKNTCLWHSTEVGKTLIGSYFSFLVFFFFFSRCILWSTCDRPPGKTQVKEIKNDKITMLGLTVVCVNKC